MDLIRSRIFFFCGNHSDSRKMWNSENRFRFWYCPDLQQERPGCATARHCREDRVVVPIDKLSILVTIAFSRIVFHEKLTKKAAAGLLCMTVGTLLLAML